MTVAHWNCENDGENMRIQRQKGQMRGRWGMMRRPHMSRPKQDSRPTRKIVQKDIGKMITCCKFRISRACMSKFVVFRCLSASTRVCELLTAVFVHVLKKKNTTWIHFEINVGFYLISVLSFIYFLAT